MLCESGGKAEEGISASEIGEDNISFYVLWQYPLYLCPQACTIDTPKIDVLLL